MGNIFDRSTKDVDENCHVKDPKYRNEIKFAYILAIIIWIIIIWALRLYRADIFGWIIILIPFVVFIINYSNLDKETHDIDPFLKNDNLLAFSFLVVILIINWDKATNNNGFLTIVILGLILIMLSMVDIWVTKNRVYLSMHIRSIFQTMGLILLTYSLYLYYLKETS